MDPITAWSLAKTAGEISNKLYELGKRVKDRDTKQQIDQILDGVSELKRSASQLEDENRDLREKLRFKSDEYEFRTPFRYHKERPDQPLCVKCFAKNVEAQMGEPGQDTVNRHRRRCLVCGDVVHVGIESF